MAEGEGGGRRDRVDPERTEVDDPFEEQTQPLARPRTAGAASSPSSEHDTSDTSETSDAPETTDTTTWGGRQPPPQLIEETDEVTTPSLPDEAEDATVVAPLADEAADGATAVIEVDASDEPRAAVAPGELAEATVVEVVENLDAAAEPAAVSPPAEAADDAHEEATVVAPLDELFEVPDESTDVAGVEAADESTDVAGVETADESTDVAALDAPDEAPTVVSTAGDSTGGSLAPSSSLHPLLLERVEPSLGRGERLRLDAAHWRVCLGRAEHNDLRLYTASASREHAVIAGTEDGEWLLTPGEGKTVKIDGDVTAEPTVLEVGMNIVMGGDHLRCVTEGLERDDMSAQTSADGLGESAASGVGARLAALGPFWWGIVAVAVLGIALILFAWFTG